MIQWDAAWRLRRATWSLPCTHAGCSSAELVDGVALLLLLLCDHSNSKDDADEN